MNGVRRFLNAATGASSSPPSAASNLADDFKNLPPTSPPIFSPKSGPSWPLAESTTLPGDSTPTLVTPALALKRDKPQPPTPPETHTRKLSNGSPPVHARGRSLASVSSSGRPSGDFSIPTPSSSPYVGPSRLVARKSVPKVDVDADWKPDWKRSSSLFNTRDELLISLLASEAVVDSRGFDILSSEEVEELKKARKDNTLYYSLYEHQVLQSRLSAATKKLALETKIRDAAKSLVKVNTSNKKISKQSEGQLEAANKRVDAAQTELLRISQRANEVHRRLMEHRAGVLSLSVRNMEKKLAPKNSLGDSGYNSPIQNGTPSLSPSRSTVSVTSTSTRFDGAHLFAGHVGALVPKRQFNPDAASAEITTLEEKLKAATGALTAAGKKQAELQRELSLLRLEKQEVETSMTLELQSAEETILALEQELPRLESLEQQHLDERNKWEEEREHLEKRSRSTEELEERLKEMGSRNGEAALIEQALAEEKERSRRELEQREAEMKELQDAWTAERNQWERERATAQDEKMEDLARLQDEMERLREDDIAVLQRAGEELEDGIGAMEMLVQTHGVVLFSRDISLPGLVGAIGSHLQKIHGKLEAYESAEEEWSVLRRKLEDDIRGGLDKRETLQMELEEARRARDSAIVELNKRLNESPALMQGPLPPVEINVPLDTDVAQITSILLPVWMILPSPEARAAKFGGSQRPFRTGSPGGVIPTSKSIAELDVRSLKALYDSSRAGLPEVGAGGAFSFEALATRVQALIADDRSLIERLLRFAQAHDLLRKNAERAQKLAVDGTNSLETYQKQVKTLEERNSTLTTRTIHLQEEVQFLQDSIERLALERQGIEAHAADQAETLRQLTEANNSLSARTLILAEEAASGPEKVRKELEVQLADCRSKLQAAETQVNAMRMLEQSQRLALMNELNSVQTENDRLRDQLRVMKR
ncbi:hypothetical protein AX15_007248 [Amanita polypyramis BW_CC]|nr:hypothetical protein AX15_007248 [Amanita polypyramis BW_CC]